MASRGGDRLGAATIAAIMVGAAALRLVALSSQPGGLYQDEAAEGLDALRILHEPGYHPLFFVSDAGREPTLGYLLAAVFRVFGSSALILRSTTAVIGIVGVGAIALALRPYGRTVMLTGTAWAAGSVWLICVARDGMRNILVPLVGALQLHALLGWAEHPTRRSALLAGALAGAGVWTYQPLKLTPLLIVLWIAVLHRTAPDAARAMLRHWRAALAAGVAGAAPMLYVAVTQPRTYFGRGLDVTPLGTAGAGDPLLLHVLRTIGMFAVTGDPNPRHDVAGLPLLLVPFSALFVVGAATAWRRRREPSMSLLLLGVAVFLAPPLLAIEGGSPHFLRALGMAPYVAGLVGVGARAMLHWSPPGSALRRGIGGSLAATLAGAALLAGGVYLGRPVADRYDAYSMDTVALAAAAGPGDTVILDDFTALTVRFLDYSAPPRIVSPGTRLAAPGDRVLALRRVDIRDALGEPAANRSTVVALRFDGTPAVWASRP